MPRAHRLAVACAVLLFASSAVAQTAPDAATVKARAENARAQKLFNLGMFREAAAAYQSAYSAKPLPDFLFNIGQCLKRLGSDADLRQALFSFRGYLNNSLAGAALRSTAEQEVAKLERELQQRERARGYRPIYKRWWFWTLIGAAVVGGTVATIVATRPPEPVRGTLDPGYIELPLRFGR